MKKAKKVVNVKGKEDKLDFSKIESKWQKSWEAKKVFEVKESSKKKFYILDMFPYPSGAGLHMGHAFVFSLGDIYARFKRLQGYNVLYPIGYDSLGLPAENAAIKSKTPPKKYTEDSIKNFMKQQKAMGWSYDWSRLVNTSDAEYYKWDQWIFLKMLEKGIAYRKKSAVNYCRKCDTVLANEQVINGKCWRHEDVNVEIKHLEQWFFKITDYAEELLDGLNKIDWPEKAKKLQKNWIGKSYGTEVDFEIENNGKENKISNVVIVHGCPSNVEKAMNEKTRTYDKHWMPWLKRELGKNGIKTEIPLMQTPWKPNYFEWKKEFDKLNINENTILIGHSCGGAFLVRWLDETKKRIKKLILVSPGKSGREGRKVLTDFYGNKTIHGIERFVKEQIVVYISDDDIPYHIPSAYEYQKELNARVVRFDKGYGHFTIEGMGTEEFPELLDEVLGKKSWPIFTTRIDTIYGVTFMVVSAQHSNLMEIVTDRQKKEVEKFLKKIKSVSEKEMDELEKEGVFTGSYAINPLTKDKVPIYAGNFVVADYGSGMVMAVPGHDQRDYEFAVKYNLPIKKVIEPLDREFNLKDEGRAFEGKGRLINSRTYNNLDSENAKENITKDLQKKRIGRKQIQFRLKDWLVSRQRYWGTPIPIIYCDKCGIVAVSEKELPVKLPEKVKFGKGNPIATSKSFVEVKCPKCHGKARRETDTMDTFVNSSWYYLRYADSKNKNKIFDEKKANYWCPIDQYIGGPEHVTMHLIYIRFYTKFLRDLGLLKFDEPALKYFTQGLVYGSDGEKMSKSKGNIVEPLDMIKKYGADTLRLALISLASPDKNFSWDEKIVIGRNKFLINVFNYFSKVENGKTSKKIESKLNKAIKEITDDVENFRHYLAIIKIKQLFSYLVDEKISKDDAGKFLKLLHIYCPFITEELWHNLGNKSFISLEIWPICDEKKIDEKLERQEEQIDNLIRDVNNILKILESKGEKKNSVKVFAIPNEVDLYKSEIEIIKKRVSLDVEVLDVKDAKKIGKVIKAKPGKPGIYLE